MMHKREIADWAAEIYYKAQELSDMVDPERKSNRAVTPNDRAAMRLDSLAAAAKNLHIEITGGQLPKHK